MKKGSLEDRRERGDLITLYKIVNGMEKMDKQDLVMMTEDQGRTRGHSKKIRKRQCVKDTGKNNFSHRLHIILCFQLQHEGEIILHDLLLSFHHMLSSS